MKSSKIPDASSDAPKAVDPRFLIRFSSLRALEDDNEATEPNPAAHTKSKPISAAAKTVSSSTKFAPDYRSSLWRDRSGPFFRDIILKHRRQKGPTCVSTCLSILTGLKPEEFQRPKNDVNTDCPVSWSDALQPYGMKLAFCPIDCRRLKYYLPELIEHDDLFALCFYCSDGPDILQEPDEDGRIVGSHIILLHRSLIYDSCKSAPLPLDDFTYGGVPLGELYTKRIFRIVSADYHRGL